MTSDHLRSPIVRLGLGSFGLFLLVGAPVSGYFLSRIILEARASASWPAVTGTITKAGVAETATGRYQVDVAYTYQVGGSDYDGSKVRASDGEYSRYDDAYRAVGSLAPGQRVPVYYNPANPGQAVLRPGAGFFRSTGCCSRRR